MIFFDIHLNFLMVFTWLHPSSLGLIAIFHLIATVSVRETIDFLFMQDILRSTVNCLFRFKKAQQFLVLSPPLSSCAWRTKHVVHVKLFQFGQFGRIYTSCFVGIKPTKPIGCFQRRRIKVFSDKKKKKKSLQSSYPTSGATVVLNLEI